MIICVDVHYRETESVAAAVGFLDWTDEVASLERVVRSHDVDAAYTPGAFYLRELPRLIELLDGISDISLVIVDGYVWLGPDRAGLGARLFDHYQGAFPVVGVAKNAFHDNTSAFQVSRGSVRPLYVTAVGTDVAEAAANVARMHGPHRTPTLLRRVDRLSRS